MKTFFKYVYAALCGLLIGWMVDASAAESVILFLLFLIHFEAEWGS